MAYFQGFNLDCPIGHLQMMVLSLGDSFVY